LSRADAAHGRRSAFAAAVVMLGLALLLPRPAPGREIVVTSLNDSGPGTLRQALADTPPGDTISFGATGTISVGTPLTVARDVAIAGPGYSPDGLPLVQLDGRGATTVLAVGSGVSTRVENLRVRNGRGDDHTVQAGGVTNHGVAGAVALLAD
jgi:hypothetical protein